MLYSWTRNNAFRKWDIEVLGSGDPDLLDVERDPELTFLSAPQDKEPGIYPRQLTVPYVDREGLRGYLSDRLFNEQLSVDLRLNDALYFKGNTYAENRRRPLLQDEFSTQFIVSDGLQLLKDKLYDGQTRTFNAFLRELLYESGVQLTIHLFTDWEEDNAVGNLPDVHRITYDKVDATYWDVLSDFCTTFGFQVFQWGGVWVVKQIDYYNANGLTRWEITTGGAVTSSVVNPVVALDIPYEQSADDAIKGYGNVRVGFGFPILEGKLVNDTFAAFADGEFDGWEMGGLVTQFTEGSSNYARHSFNGDSLTQTIDKLVRFGDFISIDLSCVIRRIATGLGFVNAEFAEVKFINLDGSEYWLKNDGTVTNVETLLTGGVNASVGPHTVSQQQEVAINLTNGFPQNFAGKVEITTRFVQQVDSGPDPDEPQFEYFDHSFINTAIDVNTSRFSRVVGTAAEGTLGLRSLAIPLSENNQQYVENLLEYNDGAWKPTQAWGGLSLVRARARNELRVRNTNQSYITPSSDFGSLNDAMALYTFGGKQYIVMSLDIVIGEDDTNAVLIENEATPNVITTDEFFDNGGEFKNSSAAGGGSGPSAPGGITKTEANALYFRQDNALSEGDPVAMRGNLELGSADDVQFGNIAGTTLRTDTGKFHAPVDYAFRNAGDTGYRKISIAQATGADHAVAAGRTLTLNPDGDGVLTWSAGAQDLTGDRSWTPIVADHGIAQRGVLSTGLQNIYGRKQFQNEAQFVDDIFLDRGQVWDDINSFLTSATFVEGLGGSGIQIEKVNGQWVGTIDGLIVRDFARFYELIVEKIRGAGGTVFINDAMKAEDIQQTADADWSWDDDTILVWDDGEVSSPGVAFGWNNNYKAFTPEDMLLEFIVDDLIKRQDYTGRGVGVTRATVFAVEDGDVVPTVNVPARWFEFWVDSGDVPPDNSDWVRIGNRTDTDRQGGIILTSSDSGAPYQRMYNGLNSWSAEGTMEIIKYQSGRLDNITDADFPDLDGAQNNLYGVYVEGGYFNNVQVRGTITILDSAASNAATKSYVDNAVGAGEGNVIIRSTTEPTERPGGAGLAIGDVWVKTDDGDLPHTWNGSAWIRAYTNIDGGNIVTGTVAANRIQASVIDAIQATISNLSAIVVNTGALTVNDDITMTSGSALANAAGDARFQLRSEGFVVDYLEGGTWKRTMSVGSGGVAISKSLTAFPSSAEFDMFIKLPDTDPVAPNQWYWTDFSNLAAGDQVVCISTGTETPPSTPAQPTVCKQSNALIVEWSAVTGADTYDVERSVGGGAYALFASNVSGTSVGDTDPFGDPDTAYQYRVRACNSGGCSTYSTASTSTTFNTATAC